MSRLACLLLALAVSGRAEVKNPDTYTYVTISDADSVDPAWAYDSASRLIVLNVYETLFFFDKSSTERLVPLIAAAVPSKANGLISADGKTITIPIRRGIRFHDGSRLTPEDVRYSLLRFMLQDRSAGPSLLLLDPLLGYASTRDADGRVKAEAFNEAARAVEVRGDSLVLHLAAPNAALPSILAGWAAIVSKAWAVRNGDWDGSEAAWTRYNNPSKETSPFYEKANGTGPFILERWDRQGKEFVLTRNERYWRGPAKLRRVVVKGVNEFGTRKLMLQAGDADVIYSDRLVYSELQGLPGVRLIDDLSVLEMNPVAFFTFRVNPVGNPYIGSGRLDGDGIPPDFFSDRDLRLGFAYAFDYESYLRDVYGGHGARATGCIPKSLSAYHNPAQPTYSFDLAKAEEHFRKAWGGKVWGNGFRFIMTYNSGNEPRQALGQMLKKAVEGLNPKFQIELRPIEWPTMLDAYTAGKLPIFVMGWGADYPDPHTFAYPMMHSAGDYPAIQKYSNPRADRLIEQAKSETDRVKRRRLYDELVRIEHEDAPHLLFLDSVRYRAERDWVRGWYHNPVFPDSPWGSYFYTLEKRG